jgi:GTP-binding protein HflX
LKDSFELVSAKNSREKAILVALRLTDQSELDVNISLQELRTLLETAGGQSVLEVVQKKDSPDARTYIGTGKAREIARFAKNNSVEAVVFDHELTPSQQRNLEAILEVKVVDRTALILDIFAQRAHSKEGKLQVELAQLTYLLPRLRGKGIELSRLGGGIGTRGPGETKLEVDRRRIRARLSHLKKELKKVTLQHEIQAKKRLKRNVFNVSLVGYTNAGKSTLLNVLTKSDVFVEDKLFATLDSTRRRMYSPNKTTIILSDTVGFIQKLPHQLIAAFHSTLSEVLQADLLVHVIDVSSSYLDVQIEAVEKTLEEIGAGQKPRLAVYNKIDLINSHQLNYFKRNHPEAIFTSALAGIGLSKLRQAIQEKAFEKKVFARK